ncbi:unnamed protein product, partial [marine sediment metagenome]
DWGKLMAMFCEAGCGIASATEPFDFSTPAGRMLMGMLAVVGEFFGEILRENVRAALEHKAAQGYHHGPPPYGYMRPVDDDGQVTPDQPLQIVPDARRGAENDRSGD